MNSLNAPHIRGKKTTKKIMLDVIIALTPALIGSIYFFGLSSLYLTLISVAVCVVTEALCEKLAKRKVTVSDLSAVVTGILISYNLSSATPLWVAAIASFFAIAIVKQLFGGIGSNVVNPALMGRIFVMKYYPASIMNYLSPFSDTVSSATVLSAIKQGAEQTHSITDMFLGNVPGALGETSAMLLLIGFLYLVVRRVISVWPSIIYLGSVVAITTIFGINPLVSLFSGGLILGGCFMLSDYPGMAVNSKCLIALTAGIITAAIRLFSPIYPEGFCFSVLITNCLAGIIDKAVKPKIYGVNLKSKGALK